MSSSIFAVAIGSSAEHGSSMRIISGSTAKVRAMHSLCCWPPEMLAPDSFILSPISSQRKDFLRFSSTFSAIIFVIANSVQPKACRDIIVN